MGERLFLSHMKGISARKCWIETVRSYISDVNYKLLMSPLAHTKTPERRREKLIFLFTFERQETPLWWPVVAVAKLDNR